MKNSQRRSRILAVLMMAAMFAPLAISNAHADTLSDIFSFLFRKHRNNSNSNSPTSQNGPQNSSPEDSYREIDLGDDEGGGPVVPEPTSMALLGTGLAGMAMAYRRRRNKN